MGQIVGNMATLGLLVLLFTAIARRAPDDRLRCWVAGWFWILVQIGLKLWKPQGPSGRIENSVLSLSTLALAAICFLISTVVLREGRRAGLRLGTLLTVVTLPCLAVATIVPHDLWLLAAAVILRQALAVGAALRTRGNDKAVLIPVSAVSLAWMLYGIGHGHSEYIVLALLGEMFFVAAVNFWFAAGERSLGLMTTCIGLMVFAAMFPAAPLLQRTQAGSSALSEIAGVSLFAVAIGMILTVLEENARSARELTKEYRLTFNTNPHPLWIYDVETLQFLAVNDAACASHGYSREEFLEMRLSDIVEKREMPGILSQVALSVPKANQASRHVCKDGSVLEMEITAHSTVFRGRRARFILGIDVTEKEELQRQVLHHSFHDNLTGLPNRALFEEEFTETVRRAVEAKEKLAVLCLNVDRFKRVNDTYGTAAGDQCLQKIAEILRANAGRNDLMARMGGDRFALVLTGLRSGLPVEHVVTELMDAFRAPMVIGERKIRLSMGAGLAVCPDDGADVATLWRSAESALGRAREAGGGQIFWSNSEQREVAEHELELESFMRAQLEKGGFQLVYQPLYAMDGQVEGVEALLRLNHPQYGDVSPARFIPIAEETGLIGPIGDWVIEEACRQSSEWRTSGIRRIPIAVNVSALQLMQGSFADRLVAAMTRFGVGPEQIDLEITESTRMLNEAEVIRQMTMLNEIGIRFSLDDFGTGHSTLNRLDKLPMRILKVDRTFIERLCATDGTRSIVQAMIWMAKALHMLVIAEGVETEEQATALSEMGCDRLQGFLLSRPVAAAEIPRLLEVRHPLLKRLGEFRHQRAR